MCEFLSSAIMAETYDDLTLDQNTNRDLIIEFLNNTLPQEGAAPCTGVLKARLRQLDRHCEEFLARHMRLNRHSAYHMEDRTSLSISSGLRRQFTSNPGPLLRLR